MAANAELIGSLDTIDDSSDEDIGDYRQRIIVSRSQESKRGITDSESVGGSAPGGFNPRVQVPKPEHSHDIISPRNLVKSPTRPSREDVANPKSSPATASQAKHTSEVSSPGSRSQLRKRKLGSDTQLESETKKRRLEAADSLKASPKSSAELMGQISRPTQDTEIIDVDALLDEPIVQREQKSVQALGSHGKSTNSQPSSHRSPPTHISVPDSGTLTRPITNDISGKKPSTERGSVAGSAANVEGLTRFFAITSQLRSAATYKYVKPQKGDPPQPTRLTQKNIKVLEKEKKDLVAKMSYKDYIETLPETWHNREAISQQFLAGAVILLAQRMAGKHIYIKQRLEMVRQVHRVYEAVFHNRLQLYKHGANLVSTYDRGQVTHIVALGSGWKYDTPRDVDRFIEEFMPISNIPLDIKLVKWDWAVACERKRRVVTPERSAYLHDYRWRQEQALLGNVVVSPAKKRRVKEHVPISSEEEERREKAVKSKRATRGLIKLKSPTPPPVSSNPIRDDPLAEFYGASDEDESEAERQETRWKMFRCMQKGGKARDACPNQDVIDKLQELWKVHSNRPDDEETWKAFSMMKCIGLIRAHPTRFESVDEAVAIKGIGLKTALKIMEIIETGELKRLDYERTEQTVVSEMFQGTYGVGPQLATKWYSLGLRTLDDVANEKFDIKLTAAQKVGIKYYDDLRERMPREEAKAIYDKIATIAWSLDPKLLMELMGSYRRGSKTCGDIDILITRNTEDGLDHKGILARILEKLHASRIIVADLGGESGDGLEAKYMGICRLSPTDRVRRIDILCIPYEQWGGALVYFTGDDIFNRSMRLLANKKGMSLNQRGLWGGVIRDPQTKLKTCAGTLIASRTEREIFAALGVPWQEPRERIRG